MSSTRNNVFADSSARSMHGNLVSLLAALALFAYGHHLASAAAASAPSSQPSPKSFEQDHFRINYPGDWKTRNDPQNVLTIDAPNKDAGELSIAVPKLPPHIPGMIPLGSVENGYVDDCKKHMSSVRLEQSSNTQVAGTHARRFTVSGKDDDGTHHLLVLAFVRSDRLYIMTGDTTADKVDAMQAAFDDIEKSWTWVK